MTDNTDTAAPAADDPPVASPSTYVRRGSRRAPKAGIIGWFSSMPVAARVAAISAIVLLLVLVVGVAVDLTFSAGRVHPGVRVDGLAVGGMKHAEAIAAIESGIKPLLDQPVKVTAGSETWELSAAQIGASVDATSLATAAYGIGRDASLGRAIGQRFSAWFGRQEIMVAVSADESLVSTLLGDIDDAAGTPPVDASVEVTGTDVRLASAKDGTGVDRSEARQKLLKAFSSGNREITLALVPRAATITDDDARDAYETALKMVSGPLKLTYDTKVWDVPAATIGGWLAFRSDAATTSADASSAVLECYLDSAEVSATIVPLVKEVGKIAKDATFKVSSGTVSIVPSQDGLGVDAEDLAARLVKALTVDGERVVELAMKRVEPTITTEAAKAMGITTRLSTYTTSYSSSNKPRVNNIHTLADALDGTLVAPGAVFSFNGAIGPRTAEKGYQEANAIVNGKLVPQLGGGVCQVGTTIFNAVFFSGLPVVERRNHSLYVSHYPKGRDATVSWGGPDFKFRNDTDHWVLVATAHSSSSVTVSLYGSPTGYDVTYVTGPFTNTVAYSVREIKDPTLPIGTKIVDEKGESGRTIVVTRTVKKNGATLHTDTFKSVYKAVEEVARVGTKVTTPSKVPTTTP